MPRSIARALVVFAAVAIAAITTTSVAPAPAAAASTVRVPDSIDASGRTDVTAALDQFLASVPEGATVEFPERAHYRVEGVIRLVGATHITIDGNGSELVAQTDGGDDVPPAGRYQAHWPRLREHITVQGANGLTLKDLSIRGPNESGDYKAALEGQAGVAIYKSAHVVLDHITVSHTYGDGVYVAGQTDDVTVRSSTFDTIGRQGIAIVNASAVVVEGNRLDGIARSVFDLEPAVPRWAIDGVHLRGNDVGNFGNFLLAAGGAGANVSDVWLEGNHVTGGSGISVFAGMPRWLRHGLHVVDNTSTVDGREVSGSSRRGVLQIAQIDGVEVRGNRQPVASGTVAVTLTDVCNATVTDNRFPGASADTKQTGQCTPGVTSPSTRPRAPGKGAANPGSTKARAGAGPRREPSKPVTRQSDATTHDWALAAVLVVGTAALLLGLSARNRRRSPKT